MTADPATILIVEDDPVARRFLADNLLADGYEVLEAPSRTAAWQLLTASRPELVLVDLGLPDGDGLELLELVRGGDPLAAVDPDLPLLVLSGRAGEADRLRGFHRGADDYVIKPYSYSELGARIAALLRRARSRRARGSRLRVGPLEIDTLSRQVRLDGAPVELAAKEFGLLCALASEPTRVFTREELLRGVWGYPEPCPTRTLDSHACRLRRKLSRGDFRCIINVWGVGYKLVDGAP